MGIEIVQNTWFEDQQIPVLTTVPCQKQGNGSHQARSLQLFQNPSCHHCRQNHGCHYSTAGYMCPTVPSKSCTDHSRASKSPKNTSHGFTYVLTASCQSTLGVRQHARLDDRLSARQQRYRSGTTLQLQGSTKSSANDIEQVSHFLAATIPRRQPATLRL